MNTLRDISTDPQPGDQIVLRKVWGVSRHDQEVKLWLNTMAVVHVKSISLDAVTLWESDEPMDRKSWSEWIGSTGGVLIAEKVDAGQ